jgi:hypothetical protein
MPRDLDLTFDISTGALTLDRVVGNYVKRSETLTLSVTIVSNGASATIPSGLVGTLKPVNTYGTVLAQWTTFAQVGATNVYTASTTINAAAVSTLLGTTTEQANCVLDFAGAGVVESDTLALVLKNNVTRDDDTAPTALLNRNDFLVSNGTGLLVNVAAGYAANGAFVAAQASLAITNATNYIEVTAAGVASVNTTAFTAGSYPLATVVASAGAITANTDLRAWITPKPAAAGGVTSITGTANEITVTGTTTPTLSLPTALTFTAKTVTGGTFNSPTLFEPSSKLYKILDNQDGTRKGHLTNDFTHVYLDSFGDIFLRSTDFVSSYLSLAHFSASTGRMSLGTSAFLSGKIGFKNASSTGTTTLDSANASPNDYTATLQAATGTLALVSGNLGTPSAIVLTNASGTASININGTVGATTPSTGAFTTLTASATTSLLLGTAGSAVGNVGFRNATSGTTTLAPATGALGTGTVTLPLSGTLAISSGAQTFTGVQSMTSPDITTSITTPSTTFALVNATATTLNIGGAATTIGIGAATGTCTVNNATLAAKTVTATADVANASGSVLTITNNNSGASANVLTALTPNMGANDTTYFNFGRANSTRNLAAIGFKYVGSGSTSNAFTVAFFGIGNQFSVNANGDTVMTGSAAIGTTLAVTGASTLTGLLTANGGITLGDAQNIAFNTTTGTKIGAATTQKLGFWNSTPIVQPTTAVSSATVVSPGGGTNLKTDDTFDGYTIAQVVKALRNAGLLA